MTNNILTEYYICTFTKAVEYAHTAMYSRTVQIKMNVSHRQKIPKQIVFESSGQTFVFNLLNTMKNQKAESGNTRPSCQMTRA